MPAITTTMDKNFGQVKHCVTCSLQKKPAPMKNTITIITPFIKADATAPIRFSITKNAAECRPSIRASTVYLKKKEG